LLESAASVLSEVGQDAATLKAIATRANASIEAVYYYFSNKEAIILALRTQYGIFVFCWCPFLQLSLHFDKVPRNKCSPVTPAGNQLTQPPM